MSVYDSVFTHFTLPSNVIRRDYQVETVETLAPLPRAGFYLDQGTGKTLTSTVAALHKLMTGDVQHVIVLMPPILIDGWLRWISNIPEVKALAYRGTPAQRKALPLGKTEFTFMSTDIFKRDNEWIERAFSGRRLLVSQDEATNLKNIASQNHKVFHRYTVDQEIQLLTGTPLSTPMDGYAFCKLIAPGVYRNFNQFQNIHVKARDFFGQVTEWQNLDLLSENMKINSVRLLRTDVLHELPPVHYTPIPYSLSNSHMRLYRQLVEEQILVLDGGGKIDATQQNRLYNMIQQIILNLEHFSGGDEEAMGFELVHETMDELDGGKLVICANYRMSNEALVRKLKKYNAVAVYGGNSSTQNRRNVDKFIDDESTKIIIIQPTSGGYGIDGLQTVCCDMLMLECPVIPRDFHQIVARLHRSGQVKHVNVRVGVADGTVQWKLLDRLIGKDEQVGRVISNVADLRSELYGI